MKLKQLFLTLLALFGIYVNAMAYDFKANGIYYLKQDWNSTAIVTFQSLISTKNGGSVPDGYDYYVNYEWLGQDEDDNDIWGNPYNVYFTSDMSGDIVIPETVTYNGTTYRVVDIMENSFENCSVTSVTIQGNNLTRIRRGSFSNYRGALIIDREIPYYEDDEDVYYPFSNCKFTSLTLGNNVTSVPAYTFMDNPGLETLVISGSITSFGTWAFYNCPNLTSVTIKNNNPIIIPAYSFPNRANATLYVPMGSKSAYEAAGGWKEIVEYITFADARVEAICLEHWDTNGDGVLSLSEAAAVTTIENVFEYTSIISFDELQYFTGLTSIDDFTFIGCSNLASITFPTSITAIRSAFSGCTSLASIDIPAGVTSIERDAFLNSNSITSISVDEDNTVYDSRNDCNAIIETITNKLILGCVNTVIPEEVSEIGSYAFYGSPFTSISIPEGVTCIGDYAFGDCSNLTSISIPTGVTDIFRYTFENCSSLTSINIPSNVTQIWMGAFYGCSSLTSINISNKVTSIGESAFERCTNLTTVVIGKLVASIGENAFYMSNKITSVYANREDPIYIHPGLFPKAASATLYVPNGTKSAYESTAYWSQFGTVVEIPSVNIGSTGYATYCSPVAMNFSEEDDIKAYIASGFNPTTGTLVLTRVTEVPAGEGLYIVGNEGSYNVPVTITDMVYSNLLKGVTKATTIYPTDGDNTNFILANGSHGVGFYTLSTSGELAAGKAYLQLPTASVTGVKALKVILDDESDDDATSIKTLSNSPLKDENIFNLAGQRLNKAQKGINIINGKKVFIK